MAGRQDGVGAHNGGSGMQKHIMGLASGVALGLLAVYGASWFAKYLERQGSSKKQKEIGMSAPPSHGSSHTDSKKHDSYAGASKEIKQDQASESQQDDDKDGKQLGQDGKEEGTSSQVGGPSHASKSTAAPSLDEKIPEPGFDAPEDKMQDIGMSWRNAGNEVVIEALCPKDLHQKDVTCNFTTSTLLLEVAGKQVAAGKLSAPIKPTECTWQFGDEHLKNPQADSKSLTVTLVKSSRKPWKDLFQVAGPAGLE